MKIVHWMLLLLFCLSHLSDARLDFWHGKERKLKSRFNDLNPNKFSPVIFIPGCGGNKMQARLNKADVPHMWCVKNEDYFDIWLNPLQMIPGIIDCWVDNMKLSYDNVTRKTKNTPGVEFRMPQWGGVEDLEWVDTTPVIDRYDFGAYFYYISEALVNRGYARGYTLFGAPYDFRKGPNENKDWFIRLKELTEFAYNINENIGITFICHSMGGRMILYFLQQMPQEWKDKYVKQVITLSTPWGGSIQAIQAISVGYDFGAELIQNNKMKQVQETCDISLPNAVEMRKDLALFENYTAPGAELHCLYGNNVGDTVDRLEFDAAYNGNPTLVKGNGDGTVNRRSLIGCGHWEKAQSQKIYQQEYQGIEHYNMLSNAAPINYIIGKLTKDNDYPRPDEKVSYSDMMKIRLF
ncbi:phospholipase A2 group XV-like [Sitodiplosis mosellana]|uniref:phospholipase A2 group XV-like n=1 Tax=Sitodiplosis mosellana TaxID=263140 RepID=UPI00244407A8|nr:phospholipase A2 group XV-like [Sitodiplosis mosellana]